MGAAFLDATTKPDIRSCRWLHAWCRHRQAPARRRTLPTRSLGIR